MSILSAVGEMVPATAPVIPAPTAQEELVTRMFFAALLAVAIGVGYALHIFRADGIRGPDRIPANRPVWPLLVSMLVAIVVWVGVQTLYHSARAAEARASQRQSQVTQTQPTDAKSFGTGDLNAADFAFLSTIPGLIALGCILAGDRLAGRHWFDLLGWTLRRTPTGIGLGILAAIITLPIIFNASIYLDSLYAFFHFEHPTEHELLNALGSTGTPFLQFAMIAGAALVAPLWEEIAFRGHLQTLLSAALARMFVPRPSTVPPPGFPMVTGATSEASVAPADEVTVEVMPPSAAVDGATAAADVEAMRAADEVERVATPTAIRWIAVILTSLLFMSVHDMWMWPAIFILSVCLGFAYERTGNLWTSIVVHFAFNSLSTMMFLAAR